MRRWWWMCRCLLVYNAIKWEEKEEREHRILGWGWGWIDNSVRAEVFIFERVNELLKSLSRFRTLEWKTIAKGKFSSSKSRALNEKWKWQNFFAPHRCRPQSSGFYNLRHHHAYLDPSLSGEDVWMGSIQHALLSLWMYAMNVRRNKWSIAPVAE